MNKYREGKLKSTLKRESKDRETVQSISQWCLEGCMLVDIIPALYCVGWSGTQERGLDKWSLRARCCILFLVIWVSGVECVAFD